MGFTSSGVLGFGILKFWVLGLRVLQGMRKGFYPGSIEVRTEGSVWRSVAPLGQTLREVVYDGALCFNNSNV